MINDKLLYIDTMDNIMTGTLSAIIKQGLDERAKKDASFASKYEPKNIDACVSAIYQAFYALAREGAKGGGGVALNGSDDLIISAAVHWYDEGEKATTDSIKNILKGGTEVKKMEQPKKEPTAKPTTKPTPKPVPSAKPVPKPVPTAKPVPTMGIAKPTPPPAKEEEEQQLDLGLFG